MSFLQRQGKYANAPRPDLILLDLNLPKKDGREVLGEIKESPTLKSIPVIILTTSASEADIPSQSIHIARDAMQRMQATLEELRRGQQKASSFLLFDGKLSHQECTTNPYLRYQPKPSTSRGRPACARDVAERVKTDVAICK
jgi:CheY-like chemotaxis protein